MSDPEVVEEAPAEPVYDHIEEFCTRHHAMDNRAPLVQGHHVTIPTPGGGSYGSILCSECEALLTPVAEVAVEALADGG